jgi:hypothetical protein
VAPVFRSIPTKPDNAATNLATRFGLHIVVTHSRIPSLFHKCSDSLTEGCPFVFKAGGCDDCRYNTPCNNCLPGTVSTQLQGLCNAAEQTQLLQMFRRGRRTFFFHLFSFGAGQFRKLLLKISCVLIDVKFKKSPAMGNELTGNIWNYRERQVALPERVSHPANNLFSLGLVEPPRAGQMLVVAVGLYSLLNLNLLKN